jgi:hypothetical protein
VLAQGDPGGHAGVHRGGDRDRVGRRIDALIAGLTALAARIVHG